MAGIDRWALERACWARGIALVCGCDEAGARWPARSTLGRSFCPPSAPLRDSTTPSR